MRQAGGGRREAAEIAGRPARSGVTASKAPRRHEEAPDLDRSNSPRVPRPASPSASRLPPPAIRVATLADLDIVVELRLALLREYATHPVYGRLRPDAAARARPLFASQIESPHEEILLAEREGSVVGIMRCAESAGSPLLIAPRYCYVSSVYVRPEARRTGVLRALLARARQWCDERGLREMRLHNVPSSPAAAGAWTALGFDVIEHVRLKSL